MKGLELQFAENVLTTEDIKQLTVESDLYKSLLEDLYRNDGTIIVNNEYTIVAKHYHLDDDSNYKRLYYQRIGADCGSFVGYYTTLLQLLRQLTK